MVLLPLSDSSEGEGFRMLVPPKSIGFLSLLIWFSRELGLSNTFQSEIRTLERSPRVAAQRFICQLVSGHCSVNDP